MRVVHLSCYVDPQGRAPGALLEAWPTLTDVAAAAAGDGIDVVVVQAATADERLERHGVPCHFVSDYRRRLTRSGLIARASRHPTRLLSRVRDLDPDVVHLHGLGFLPQMRSLQRVLPRVPVLVQDHADRPPRPLPWRTPLAPPRIAVAFTSAEQADPFVAARVIRHDVPVFEILESSTRFTTGDGRAARARTGLHGDPCLVWVGRLSPVKDPLTVLEALSRAAPHLTQAHLWCFFAEAPLLRAVKHRIAADPDLAGRVHLQGSVPHAEIEYVMRAADFLVLGSRSEGSGYAVIEALACGTTPLVTDIPALRRITGGGRVGALSPLGDSAAFSDALCSWAHQNRETLRRAARAHFETSLSFEVVGRDLRAAYRRLAS